MENCSLFLGVAADGMTTPIEWVLCLKDSFPAQRQGAVAPRLSRLEFLHHITHPHDARMHDSGIDAAQL